MRSNKLITAALLTSVLVSCNRQKAPPSVADTAANMSTMIKEHRFDEAATFGLSVVTKTPSDASIYYLVSLAYAERAHYKPGTTDESLKLVDKYATMSVSISPSDQLNRYNIAWVLEYAGDVGSDTRCSYYGKSIELLNQIYGSLLPSNSDNKPTADPLKDEVIKSTSRVTQKLKNAGCR